MRKCSPVVSTAHDCLGRRVRFSGRNRRARTSFVVVEAFRPLKRALLAPMLLAIIVAAGCCPPDVTRGGKGAPWTGPTDPMAKVVADVNANASGVTSIWSDHTFHAWIHDDKGKRHYVDGDGVLLFRKTPA